VSDDRDITNVVTAILNRLHHTSLLGSNPRLSSDDLSAEFGRKSAI
jgi:hypothetical protein